MIEVRNLVKTYRTSKSAEVNAVHGISFTLEDKGLVSIVGKSGCGKSTLLTMMASYEKPTEGDIIYCGLDEVSYSISSLSEKELDALRNRYIGFIHQSFHLIKEWTVLDNLRIVLEQQNTENKNEDLEKKIDDILKFVGMEGCSARKISELSGGQQQRVAIARAMIKNPKVLFADEPTGNLDSETSLNIMKLLKQCSDHCLVVVVTHDLDLAKSFSERILYMADGRIVDDQHNETNANVVQNVTEDCKNIIIKNLSAKVSIRLAWKNLLVKKAKVILTIIAMLIVISFVKMMVSLLTADAGKALAKHIKEDKIEFLYPYEKATCIDIKGVMEALSIKNSLKLRNMIKNEAVTCYEIVYTKNISIGEQSESMEGKIIIDGRASKKSTLVGRLPSNSDEVVLSDSMLILLGMEPNSLGSTVYLDERPMVICGIENYHVAELLEEADSYLKKRDVIYSAFEKGGDRVLVAGSYRNLLEQTDCLKLSFADLTQVHTMGTAMDEKNTFSTAAALQEADLMYGHLPKKSGEIVISYDFFINNMIYLTEDNQIEGEYGFQNIYDKSQNEALNGFVNLYDFFPEISVVGITNEGIDKSDFYLYDVQFEEIRKMYAQNYYADAFEIVVEGATTVSAQYLNDLLENNIHIDSFGANIIESEVADFHSYRNVAMAVICGLLFLLLLLFILFFSFNVRDNYYKIGVLRSLGVSAYDLTRIWLIESVMVLGILEVLSIAIDLFWIKAYNQMFQNRYFIKTDLLYMNIKVEIIELVLAAVITLITVFLPIWVASDKKPMELLRE